ncbi:MAG: hypothetical protein ACI8RD_009092 [Bacillariaceae sp.]|jgi:hypothetical protein
MIRRSETRREKISTAKFADNKIKIIALHRQIHKRTKLGHDCSNTTQRDKDRQHTWEY